MHCNDCHSAAAPPLSFAAAGAGEGRPSQGCSGAAALCSGAAALCSGAAALCLCGSRRGGRVRAVAAAAPPPSPATLCPSSWHVWSRMPSSCSCASIVLGAALPASVSAPAATCTALASAGSCERRGIRRASAAHDSGALPRQPGPERGSSSELLVLAVPPATPRPPADGVAPSDGASAPDARAGRAGGGAIISLDADSHPSAPSISVMGDAA